MSADAGRWSMLWARRVAHWHDHITRTLNPTSSPQDVAGARAHLAQDVAGAPANRWVCPLRIPHPAARVLIYHNEHWLIQQRANFATDGRNTLLAGRTGTRLNIGRPQTRWETGHATAVQMLGHRTTNDRSSNMLSVGTIFREVVTSARAVLEQW